MPNKIIMHVDVNSAFLSWQAVYNLQHGDTLDLREIPSVVGGNQSDRRGIVLAKSTPAKKYGIRTAEVIWQAKQKCPDLVIVPPNYELYMRCSNSLIEILYNYSPLIQRFSIDEAFIDYTGMEKHFGDPICAAYVMKERIKKELGFTVNIGIGPNKLLAKVAGDLKKPDMVHTLLNKEEVEEKMWPLPVEDLFMVGRASKRKLDLLNIKTIGDLANSDVKLLQSKLKSHGILIWQYANGIDNSKMRDDDLIPIKGIGNSTTIKFDVADYKTAYKILLSLTESVAARLRKAQCCCQVISVEVRASDFQHYSCQRKIFAPTNITMEIFEVVRELFVECWRGEEVRHLGVRVTDLCSDEFCQDTFFDYNKNEKLQALDATIDNIRAKYGKYSIMRSVFLDGEIKPMTGGVDSDEFPPMSSIL